MSRRLQATFGDLPHVLDMMGLPALWRRLAAATDRVEMSFEREARLLAAVTNAPHVRLKRLVKAGDLFRSSRSDTTGGFHTREEQHYDRRVTDLLTKDDYGALGYARALKGRERGLLREAIERRLPGADHREARRLKQIRRAIPGD